MPGPSRPERWPISAPRSSRSSRPAAATRFASGGCWRDGTSIWWQAQSRNKRSLALDLRESEAQDIVRRLAAQADVLIENFRPGAMEGWGLGPEALQAVNPALIMLRISGYGQSGPYRDRPGFGVVAEAMGGLRHLTAEPGRVPVRVGVSIGDTLASLHGVIGILMALHHRHATVSERTQGRGQVIDVALYEAVFNCMESLLPEYSAFGAVREAAGSALPGIAPSNAYRCADGYALVAGNGDSIFKRLMRCIGRADLADDPALANNTGRVAQVEMIDAAIGALDRQPQRGAGAGGAGSGAGARRPHLHRGRHRRRPALRRARHAAGTGAGGRQQAVAARLRTQDVGHAGQPPARCAGVGAGHRCGAARGGFVGGADCRAQGARHRGLMIRRAATRSGRCTSASPRRRTGPSGPSRRPTWRAPRSR